MRNLSRTFVLFFLLPSVLLGCDKKKTPTATKYHQTPSAIQSPLAPVSPLALSPLPSPTAQAPPSPVPETGSLDSDGEMAFQHAVRQMDFGARPTGSAACRATGDYIIAQLEAMGWEVEEQNFEYLGTPVRNIIGRAGEGPVVIIGAHYDTRRRADLDPQDPSAPVPGANDGASGVAVLLELARILDKGELTQQVWLTFFDAEDNGHLDGWDWIVGSSYMAEHLTITPKYVIIVDMIGDADQQIYRERNSDPGLSDKLWNIAAELGYGDQFVNEVRHSIIDDHTPFVQRGITAVDIIDFDYPYWHTSADTLDKISPLSLERVGRVLETLLGEQP